MAGLWKTEVLGAPPMTGSIKRSPRGAINRSWPGSNDAITIWLH